MLSQISPEMLHGISAWLVCAGAVLFLLNQGMEFIRKIKGRPAHPPNEQLQESHHELTRRVDGIERDLARMVPLMNRVYASWNRLRNHFHPTFKLKSKEKQGSRYLRRYEVPRTPYQRLLDCPELSPLAKHQLKEQHQQLNPFGLKKKVEQDLKTFFTALGNLNREATNP